MLENTNNNEVIFEGINITKYLSMDNEQLETQGKLIADGVSRNVYRLEEGLIVKTSKFFPIDNAIESFIYQEAVKNQDELLLSILIPYYYQEFNEDEEENRLFAVEGKEVEQEELAKLLTQEDSLQMKALNRLIETYELMPMDLYEAGNWVNVNGKLFIVDYSFLDSESLSEDNPLYKKFFEYVPSK